MKGKSRFLIDNAECDISLWVFPSRELQFPHQPHKHLLEFRFDGKTVAYIDQKAELTVLDKEKLVDILINLPKEFVASANALREARLQQKP